MPYRPGAARPLLPAVTAALFLAPLSDVGHAQPSDDFVPLTDARRHPEFGGAGCPKKRRGGGRCTPSMRTKQRSPDGITPYK